MQIQSSLGHDHQEKDHDYNDYCTVEFLIDWLVLKAVLANFGHRKAVTILKSGRVHYSIALT